MPILSLIFRYLTIAGALGGVVAIVFVSNLQAEKQMPPPGEPPVPPPHKPFAKAVAATGILEAICENVSIGVPAPGLVAEVGVKVNDVVKKDQVLFRMDDRDLRAEEISSRAKLEIDRALIEVAEAQLAKYQAQLARLTGVDDKRAVSKDELGNRQQDVLVATAQLAAAKAQFASTEAALKRISILIDRLTIRAPRDGTILQVNTRAGEYVANTPKSPAMVLGNLDLLQVRADVDEQNATRVREGQKAQGHLKGDPSVTFDLEFVRVEPYVIPKVSLTGASTERIDTRVLQVIFSLKRPANPPLYVGQQVNVFIAEP